MHRKPHHALAALMFTLTVNAHAQGITFTDPPQPNAPRAGAAPTPAAPATPAPTQKPTPKQEVTLLCEGALRVFYILTDGTERDSGAEHRHDLSLRVIDKKAFRSVDDAESAVQIRFEDPKICLSRSNGSACMRQVENADGRRMTTRDYFDIDRYTGRVIYTYLRSYHEPVQHGTETLSAVRLEYNGHCGRADAPRTDNKAAAPTAAPATQTIKPIAPAAKPAASDAKPGSFWVIKETAPEAKR